MVSAGVSVGVKANGRKRLKKKLTRLRAVPLFRYFRAGNGRFLGLAVWRNRHLVSTLIFH